MNSDNKISVSQFNNYLKSILDSEEMLRDIEIYGEVSSFYIKNNIAYFNIKDADALLPCIMFGANRFFEPKIGDKIVVKGSVNYYVKGGRLSFNATKIEEYGVGDLYKQFLKLKENLEKEGLFDKAVKKPMPKQIKNIGVVTSNKGAVIQDIINVTRRRDSSVNIVLYSVKVQGEKAELEIAKGVEFFNNYDVDVVIVARGGGSIEDLAPFNTEVLARAIFNSNKPLVSAVGHETDFTISDFVSDLRAPTPSAAAELVVADKSANKNTLDALISRLYSAFNTRLRIVEDSLINFQNRASSLSLQKLALAEVNIKQLKSRLISATGASIVESENKLKLIENTLKNINPQEILNKGYAKLEIAGIGIDNISQVNINDVVTAHIKGGALSASVKNIKEND